ncbi:hypothetical protein GVAV_000747 [Gurleya vavrai]
MQKHTEKDNRKAIKEKEIETCNLRTDSTGNSEQDKSNAEDFISEVNNNSFTIVNKELQTDYLIKCNEKHKKNNENVFNNKNEKFYNNEENCFINLIENKTNKEFNSGNNFYIDSNKLNENLINENELKYVNNDSRTKNQENLNQSVNENKNAKKSFIETNSDNSSEINMTDEIRYKLEIKLENKTENTLEYKDEKEDGNKDENKDEKKDENEDENKDEKEDEKNDENKLENKDEKEDKNKLEKKDEEYHEKKDKEYHDSNIGNIILNLKNESQEIPVIVKKKRGRKKKIVVEEEIKKSKINEVSDNLKILTKENIETLNATFEVKEKKKRGRKKKIIVEEEIVVEKRGRKKKSETISKKEEPVKKLVNKKEKIMHFLNKDQFQILYPEEKAFKNRRHAIECLMPFHIFGNNLYEDLQFFAAEDFEIIEDFDDFKIKEIKKRFDDDFLKYDENLFLEDNLVLDILKTEEYKYLQYRAIRKVEEDKILGNRKDKVKIIIRYLKLEKNEYKTIFKIDRDYYNILLKK